MGTDSSVRPILLRKSLPSSAFCTFWPEALTMSTSKGGDDLVPGQLVELVGWDPTVGDPILAGWPGWVISTGEERQIVSWVLGST